MVTVNVDTEALRSVLYSPSLHPPVCYMCFEDTENPLLRKYSPDVDYRISLCSQECIDSYKRFFMMCIDVKSSKGIGK